MKYKPLSVLTPRLERKNLELKYRAKADECHQLAAVAYTPLEKAAWLELAADWERLAKEAAEPLEV
jgi:hypothetical protein